MTNNTTSKHTKKTLLSCITHATRQHRNIEPHKMSTLSQLFKLRLFLGICCSPSNLPTTPLEAKIPRLSTSASPCCKAQRRCQTSISPSPHFSQHSRPCFWLGNPFRKSDKFMSELMNGEDLDKLVEWCFIKMIVFHKSRV